MGYAFVQKAKNTAGTGTSIQQAYGSNVTAGSMLVAFATSDGSSSHTFSSTGDSWTTVTVFNDTGAGQFISIGFAPNATGGAKTVTCTFGAAGNFNGLIIAEFSGGATSSALDTNTPGRHNAATSTPTDASMSTAVDGDLILSVLMLDALGATVSAGSGFTLLDTDSNGMSAEWGVQATHGSIAPSFSLSAAVADGILSAALKPAAAASTATPQPIVVSVPTSRPVAGHGIVVRASLANPPVLTTPAPIVAALLPPQQLPARAVVQRNTLVDPANPVPIVVSQPWLRTLPPAVTIARGDLVDPPVLTTPGPLVVARHVPAPLPTPAVVLRASLVDAAAPPAVATPAPIVAGLTAPWPPIPQPVTVRPIRVDPPVATTPAPLVNQLPYSPAPIPAVVLVRSTLVDPVTPAPIVVWPPQRPPVITPALIARGSLVDPPTQAPLVATWTWRPAPVAQPLLFRSSLADAAAPVATAAPPPLITRPPQWTFMTGSIIIRPLMVPCSCITLRPSTGTTAYNLATTARPDTGVTPDPCSC